MTAPVHYVEPGRNWWALAYPVALLGIGAGLDAGFGYFGDHWVGWTVAFVLVVGGDAVLIRAGRMYKTLTIDAAEIRVGEEAIERAEVLGAESGTDDSVPVLGWLTGMPKRRKGVLLELSGGGRAALATRRPTEVLQVLGVSAPSIPDSDVRPATAADLPLLAEIDARADAVFRVAGYHLPDDPDETDDWEDAAAIFVVGAPPVGFARMDVLDGSAHLTEIAVLPGSMKRGLGSALIERCCDWARGQGHSTITLTTFAAVPWNGPWYARRGWIETDDYGPEVAAARDREAENGLDDVASRIVMRRRL